MNDFYIIQLIAEYDIFYKKYHRAVFDFVKKSYAKHKAWVANDKPSRFYANWLWEWNKHWQKWKAAFVMGEQTSNLLCEEFTTDY